MILYNAHKFKYYFALTMLSKTTSQKWQNTIAASQQLEHNK